LTVPAAGFKAKAHPAPVETDASAWSASRMYHFLVSAVAPRPIAWVTTKADGVVNAAPFSWYQSVCADPPIVALAIADQDGHLKDTARNILITGEFVINAVTAELAQTMVATSATYAPTQSEIEALSIATTPSAVVAPPRIAASPFHLECRLHSQQRLGREHATTLILGEVVHIAVDDAVLDARGNIDITRCPLVARLGGRQYLNASNVYELERPKHPGAGPAPR
jgi:flavin reductase (DIM6/NTAB) family NADH-FMN oxidoreductase RutF